MGGDRETTIPAKADSVQTGSEMGGNIRIHEKAGEVHFHGKAGFKVAVPVNRWYSAWNKLRALPGRWKFYDTKTNCLLEVWTHFVDEKINVQLSVIQAKTTPDFASLDKFTNG